MALSFVARPLPGCRQQEKNLDSRQPTELVVGFVQNITYRLPTEDTAAFGMLPPAIVVADGSGDCDSKALLAVVILLQLNVDGGAARFGPGSRGARWGAAGDGQEVRVRRSEHFGSGAGPLAAQLRHRQGVEGHPR